MTTADRYAALRACGLCTRCGKVPPREGRTTCAPCDDQDRALRAARNAARRAARIAAGVCARCGKNQPAEGLQDCEACQEYTRNQRLGRSDEVKERRRVVHKEWALANPDKISARDQRYRDRLRADVLGHYGGVCACCGENEDAFLTLDHINGGGNDHRRSLMGRNTSGGSFYRRIRALGFPGGLQVLCWNCNMAKAHRGVCPHQER